MPEPTAAPGETPAAAPVAPASETPAVEEEKFDKERAMALIAKLRQEVKDLGGKAKKADELEAAELKRKEAEMTEAQKLAKKLAEAESRLKSMELQGMQRAAAEKVGIPLIFANRLQGETPEQLEEDAKLILKSLPETPKLPNINPTNPAGASQGETAAQRLAQIHGQGADIFSPDAMRKLGGGVYQSSKTE